ncbi:hypothetical protein [Brachyspira pilosicoli]|uniref:hypothetical protein n=1 Tax=Brachyspira pilosicoli TaxID=52584 RepID=UPI0030072F88
MSKKFLSLISVLFLVSILAVSCSNKDKTGDGGTTPQGIAKHAGSWDFKEDSSTGNGSGTITIKEDGSVNFTIAQKPYTTKDVADKGNETYEAKFVDEDPNGEISSTLILTLTFNSDNKTGSYEVKIIDTNTQETQIKNGTLTKQQ